MAQTETLQDGEEIQRTKPVLEPALPEPRNNHPTGHTGAEQGQGDADYHEPGRLLEADNGGGVGRACGVAPEREVQCGA